MSSWCPRTSLGLRRTPLPQEWRRKGAKYSLALKIIAAKKKKKKRNSHCARNCVELHLRGHRSVSGQPGGELALSSGGRSDMGIGDWPKNTKLGVTGLRVQARTVKFFAPHIAEPPPSS